MTRIRVGFGSDVHAFGPGDHLMLGGIRVPHAQGVVAHSDGDVLLHALCDALLGAAGEGDIGVHFPDSDARWRGVAGSVLLGHTLARIRGLGFQPVNVDLTLIAARPKLAPYRDAIRARIAAELGIPLAQVNVKATTTEGLGFIGRGEGIAAEAAVLIEAAG